MSLPTGVARFALVFLRAALCAICWCSPLSAHHALGPTTATCFFKLESGEAHFLIRIPLTALETVGFPLTERELDLANAGPAIQSVLGELRRDVVIEDDGRVLAPSHAIGRLSLPSDRSYQSYDAAVRHVGEGMPTGMTIYAEQGFFDAHLTYPINSSDARFAIRSNAFPELGDYLTLAVRFIPVGIDSRIVNITSQTGSVQLNPAWYGAAGDFVLRGGRFAVTNVEYLLFLLCIIVPLPKARRLIAMLLTFTGAHCATLLGLGYARIAAGPWFSLFVQTGVAASIVCMSLATIIGANRRGPWITSWVSGLVFGLQFSFAFKDRLQFAGDNSTVSLISFVAGIEIGQLLLVAVAFPLVAVLRRYVFVGRTGMIVLLAVIAVVAWPWMLERGEMLSRAHWPMNEVRAAAPWLLASVVGGSVLGLLVYWRRRIRARLHGALIDSDASTTTRRLIRTMLGS
jgi:hypothetical protein